MLEGFKPLDLSALGVKSLGGPVNWESLATSLRATPNTNQLAKKLAAGANWDFQPEKAPEPEVPEKPSFLSGLFDLISTPSYMLMNAIDKGMSGANKAKKEGGNQAHDFLVGLGEGAVRGLGAGLTGATAMFGADELPNVLKNDKKYAADVIRNQTGIEPIQGPDGNFYVQSDFDKGDLSKPLTEDQAKKMQLGISLGGLGLDIVSDPLNLIRMPSIASKAKNLEKIEEIPGSTGKGIKTEEIPALNTMPKTSVAETSKPVPVNVSGSVPLPTKELGIKNAITQAPITPTEAVPNFDDFLRSMMNEGELNAAKVEPVLQTLHRGSILDENVQANIASRLSQITKYGMDSKKMIKEATDMLRRRHPGLDFPNVEDYLETLRTASPRFFEIFNYSGKNAERAQVSAKVRAQVLDKFKEAVKQDALLSPIAKGKKGIGVKGAAQVIDENPIAGRPIPLSGKLGNAESVILSDVIKKYSNEVTTGMFKTAANPTKLAASLASGSTAKWNAAKQANVWDTIVHKLVGTGNLKYATPSRYTKAMQMLRAFEDHYMSMGHTPYSAIKMADSVPLRLSDVVARIGPKEFARHGDLITTILRSSLTGNVSETAKKAIKSNPELARTISQAVQDAKAGAAISEAPEVAKAIEGARVALNLIDENAMSAARRHEAIDATAKMAYNFARGGAPGHMAQQAIRDMYNLGDPVDLAVSSNKMNTLRQLSHDTINPAWSNGPAITRAIEGTLGSLSAAGREVGPAAKTLEWLGARFNAWYKNPDMRPVYLEQIGSARASVGRRAEQINEIVKKYGNNGDEWNAAWNVARGATTTGNQNVQNIANEIQKVMENLFGTSGLRTIAGFEDSVVGRAQIIRKDLNSQLKRFGIPREFSKTLGIEWMDDWKNWDNLENPMQLLFKIQNAVEMAVRTRSMYDEIIGRFGRYHNALGKSTDYGHKLPKEILRNHPYFQNVRFTEEGVQQAEYFFKAYDEMLKPGSKFVQELEGIMSKWKSSVTIYRPAHYIRNLIGDVTFNWLAGVNGTRAYSTAQKVMKSQKGMYEWDEIGDLTSPDALKRALSGTAQSGPAGQKIALTMKNGQKITNDMVYIAAFQKGLLPSARVLEDIPDDVASKGLSGALGRIGLPGKMRGKGQAFAHNIHEQRDHFVRLAHFIDVLSKSRKSFPEAVDEATAIVRKWHPDGMDLTPFERKRMRLAFPFYSWTRKAIPLVLESIYTQPAKVGLYPKLQYGAGLVLGGQDPTGSRWQDPFPEDQLWPDYFKEKGIGPIAGVLGDYTFVNPSNPVLDVAAEFGRIPQLPGEMFAQGGFDPASLGGVGGMLNPLAKVPAEILTGTSMSTAAPIKDWTQYATGQIPGVADVSRLTNVDVGGASPKFADQGFGNIQGIINLLTAAGYQQTTPKTAVSGQMDMREYLKRLREG